MRAVALVAVGAVVAGLGVGCSRHEESASGGPGADGGAGAVAPAAAGAGARDGGPIEATGADRNDAGGSDAAATDAEAPDGAAVDGGSATTAARRRPHPRVVLHVGDSTVGDGGGLELALDKRFHALGATFHHDAWVSASIWSVEHADKLKKLIRHFQPDLVIVTLGTNDVFHPTPAMLGPSIADISRKAATLGLARGAPPRECWWIGPPTWKKDLGVVDVIRKHAAPCRFFDSSLMGIERRPDGVHPTDKGGEEWARRFWAAYESDDGAAVSGGQGVEAALAKSPGVKAR